MGPWSLPGNHQKTSLTPAARRVLVYTGLLREKDMWHVWACLLEKCICCGRSAIAISFLHDHLAYWRVPSDLRKPTASRSSEMKRETSAFTTQKNYHWLGRRHAGSLAETLQKIPAADLRKTYSACSSFGQKKCCSALSLLASRLQAP